MAKGKKENKKFSLIWGSSHIEEEAQIASQYHIPTIQLLNFKEDDAKC